MIEDVSTQPPLDSMVHFLVDLESPYEFHRSREYDPYELVRFALVASDYWADRALDWLTFGLNVGPVEVALRELIDDRRRPQPLRHRALRIVHTGQKP